MLAQIRTFAKSAVAKVLLALLVCSFAVFGIADVFRTGAVKDAVIQAGPRKVTAVQFKQRFDQFRKDIEQRQNGGMPITMEQIAQAGLDRAVADQVAVAEAMGAEMTRIGIIPSDKQVLAEIRKTPAFFDQVSGLFDRPTYQQKLNEIGLTEASYESELRDEIAQQHLVSGLAAGLVPPRTYLASVAAYNGEARDITWFPLNPAITGAPVKPTDLQLAAYVKDNAARFTKPELRLLSFVRFSSAEVAKTLTASDADVLKRFNFEKDTLSKPETRSLVEVPVKDAAAGAKAADLLRMGQDPAAVAKAVGSEPVVYTDAPKGAISDRKIADVAFGPLKQGDVAGPTQGSLGMAVVKITKVTPGVAATLADSRAKIEDEIKKDQATEKVYQTVQKYDDARSGGANMAEAAKQAGVPVLPIMVPLTAQGTTLQGQNANIPPKLIQSAFSLPQSGESEVIDLGGGEYAAVRVDKVLPSALASLDEVRNAATQMFVIAQMRTKLQAKADAITAALKKGQTMDQAAASVGAKAVTVTNLRRDNQGQTWSNDFMSKLFTAKPGEVVVGPDNRLGLVVARLDKAYTAPTQELAVQAESQRDMFRELLFEDLSQAARSSARTTIKTKIDYAQARTAIGLEADAPGAPPAGAKK